MIYKDKSKTVEERVENLLGLMTLKEKVAQLCCAMVSEMKANPEKIRELLKDGIGTLSYLNSSLSGDNHKDMDFLHEVQKYLVEETRLGIPVLVHSEGIAGAQIPGATTFPQSIGLAATWEPGLAEKMGEVVKKQLAAYGIKAVHSPLFDLGRDPRWGRISETYGEDPYLVSQMGTAYVKGVQGNDEVMATAKHFIGYGNSEGGRNCGEAQIGERKLLDAYAVPFEAAIHEGKIMAVMNSYGILNEEPVAVSKKYLTDLLRKKLGFEGAVVSDYGSVSHVPTRYRTAESLKEAAVLALKAGIDVEQPNDVCYRYLVEAVENGEIEEALIDRSVRRILSIKFRLGLFENPYGVGDFETEISSNDSKELSREIAEKSIVLLKNTNHILPLPKTCRIALVGPSADDRVNYFGGYSAVSSAMAADADFDRSQEDQFLKMAYKACITEYKEGLIQMGMVFDKEPSPEQKEIIYEMLRKELKNDNKVYKSMEEFMEKYYPNCKSVLDAFKEQYGEENILYEKGCSVYSEIEGGIEAVLDAAKQADVVVAVVGGRESMLDSQATCGENRDNINIGLEKCQRELMEALFETGKPVITIVIDGRPLAIADVEKKSAAVLYAWLPAEKGAEAIANIITGAVCPTGKLPVTVAKDAGQIPMYYDRLPIYADIEDWAEYIDKDSQTPLYTFGSGLSYTEYEYSDLVMNSEVPADGKITISFKVKNIGERAGEEIVQLYLRDSVSSVARPVKQLCGFKRVPLCKGEEREVTFIVEMRQIAFHNLEMEQVVEPGTMEVFVGASSSDIRLTGKFEIIGETVRVERKAYVSVSAIS